MARTTEASTTLRPAPARARKVRTGDPRSVLSDGCTIEEQRPLRFGPSRRGVLGALVAVPGALLLGAAGRGLRGVAPGLRPAPRGRSSLACAQCGAGDHTMLDGACPAGPRILGAEALRTVS